MNTTEKMQRNVQKYRERLEEIRRDWTMSAAAKRQVIEAAYSEARSTHAQGWREGKDDDLVLAVATSVWATERFLRKKNSVPVGGHGYPWAASAG